MSARGGISPGERERQRGPGSRPRYAAGCAVTLLALSAHADGTKRPTKAECAIANGDAQVARMGGKFAASRALLEMCGKSACPALVRDDCVARLEELERDQPTVVFEVMDATGAEVPIESVSIDGATPGPLSGSLRVDPGEHTFTLSLAGHPPVQRHLAVREGEKDRRVPVVLPRQGAPAASRSGGLGARRIVGLAVGGAGLATAVVGGVFGAMTLSAVSQQKADCPSASDCPRHAQALSDHSTLESDGNASTALFAAAGVLIAGGCVLLFISPTPTSTESPTLSLTPAVGPAGGGLTLEGRF